MDIFSRWHVLPVFAGRPVLALWLLMVAFAPPAGSLLFPPRLLAQGLTPAFGVPSAPDTGGGLYSADEAEAGSESDVTETGEEVESPESPDAAEPPGEPPVGEEAVEAEPAPEPEPVDAADVAEESEAEPLPGIVAPTKPSRKVIGVGLALMNEPIESDLSGSGLPIDAYFEDDILERFYKRWPLRYRVALNQAEAQIAGGSVETTAIYGAIRKKFGIGQLIRPYALVGVAYMTTKISGIDRIKTSEDSGFGVVAGFGALYTLQKFRVGAQFLVLRREGKVGGGDFASGSNQFQITFELPLNFD